MKKGELAGIIIGTILGAIACMFIDKAIDKMSVERRERNRYVKNIILYKT